MPNAISLLLFAHVPVPADRESGDQQRQIGRQAGRQHLSLRQHGAIITGTPPYDQSLMTKPSTASSVAEVRDGLKQAGYLADESAALVSYLAQRLGKPVLVEGPAGVGKTELAKALSRYTGAAWCGCSATRASTRPRRSTSGTTASSCCGSRPRPATAEPEAKAPAGSWEATRGDIFGEEFLLTRPLLEAISSEEPVVLLIDEIDKTDQEFEAMLLEVLSDFQISIPELGVIEARHAAAGAAHLEQLARADRGAEAPLPLPLARLPGGRARARDRPPAHARARRGPGAAAGRDRPHGARARPQEAALDRRVDRLGAGAAADRRRRHRPRDLRERR